MSGRFCSLLCLLPVNEIRALNVSKAQTDERDVIWSNQGTKITTWCESKISLACSHGHFSVKILKVHSLFHIKICLQPFLFHIRIYIVYSLLHIKIYLTTSMLGYILCNTHVQCEFHLLSPQWALSVLAPSGGSRVAVTTMPNILSLPL